MALAGGRRQLFFQIVRFGINGSIVTGILTLVWLGVAKTTHASPQVCNLVSYVAAVCAGYVLHSRVTFRGHGARGWGSVVRFVIASLPSYALNTFWTWLLTKHFHLAKNTPLILIWTVTPFINFTLNRFWAFR